MITIEVDQKQVGARIRQIRKGLGVSQTEFAALLGLKGASTVSDYEKGDVEPKFPALRKIAELGKVSVDWLLTGIENLNAKPTAGNGTPDNDALIDSLKVSDAKKLVAKELLRMSDEDVLEWYLERLKKLRV